MGFNSVFKGLTTDLNLVPNLRKILPVYYQKHGGHNWTAEGDAETVNVSLRPLGHFCPQNIQIHVWDETVANKYLHDRKTKKIFKKR